MAADGVLRRSLKSGVREVWRIELWWRRGLLRLSGRPMYRLQGACNGCGACCESPTVLVGTWTIVHPWLRRWFVRWHRWVNQFELLRFEPLAGRAVFRCRHYDPETRSCDSYRSRPMMCRDYPRALLYAPAPEFFDECGYRAVHRRADTLAVAIERLELSSEQRAKLANAIRVDPRDADARHR